jgi:Domain of unknown function (DUF4148)
MNTKLLIATALSVAALPVFAGEAMPWDAPSRTQADTASTVTRQQVVADLNDARAKGQLKFGDSQYPAIIGNAQQPARASVKVEADSAMNSFNAQYLRG